MIPELFLIVSSTICFGTFDGRLIQFSPGESSDEMICAQRISISTFQPVARDGETVYRVVPPAAPVGGCSMICRRFARHFWGKENTGLYSIEPKEYCAICGKLRRKIKKVKEVEEWEP